MTTKTNTVRINSKPVSGVCEAVRVLFDNGVVDFPDVVARLGKTKLQFSEATVRTQLHKLRAEAGLTDRSTGPTAMVREALDGGCTTLEDAVAYIEQHIVNSEEMSLPTIKTQFYKQNRARLLALAEANSKKAPKAKARARKAKAKATKAA